VARPPFGGVHASNYVHLLDGDLGERLVLLQPAPKPGLEAENIAA
jgi:hypothetical protein